ncbi:MAG: hypothetical protein H6741_09485 [Alphaproteobacteria bacterium]|nr:hypothetical protein [Alphaproteobacteria bacterium]MCB9792946.1 hypothetical protein [Alphaproteobacteria bacterium]
MQAHEADSLLELAQRLRRVARMHHHAGLMSSARVAEVLRQEADLIIAMVEHAEQDESPTLVPEPEPAGRWQSPSRARVGAF